MKRLIISLLCASMLLLCACSGSGEAPAESGVKTTAGTEAPATEALPEGMPTVLDQNEYVLYQNIFFNDMAGDYLGKVATKEGTLARLYDAFNNRTRYYVWGYMDATKCCDWQWEFVPRDPDSLPANGSLVRMTGTFVQDEDALDKLWFADAAVTALTEYQPAPCEVDMTTMDATLERVQLLNMQYKPDVFKGMTLRLYGRVLNPTTIQHPYYDNAWTQPIRTEAEVPAIGTMVIVTGTWQGDTIQAGKVEGTGDY